MGQPNPKTNPDQGNSGVHQMTLVGLLFLTLLFGGLFYHNMTPKVIVTEIDAELETIEHNGITDSVFVDSDSLFFYEFYHLDSLAKPKVHPMSSLKYTHSGAANEILPLTRPDIEGLNVDHELWITKVQYPSGFTAHAIAVFDTSKHQLESGQVILFENSSHEDTTEYANNYQLLLIERGEGPFLNTLLPND